MLNDILAGCVAAAVVVVFATIFGAVELMWKVLHAVRRVTGSTMNVLIKKKSTREGL